MALSGIKPDPENLQFPMLSLHHKALCATDGIEPSTSRL